MCNILETKGTCTVQYAVYYLKRSTGLLKADSNKSLVYSNVLVQYF